MSVIGACALQREMRVQLLYMSPLMHMLHRGDSVDAITAWLTYVVEERIGIRPPPDREQEFAQALSDWWAAAIADGSE